MDVALIVFAEFGCTLFAIEVKDAHNQVRVIRVFFPFDFWWCRCCMALIEYAGLAEKESARTSF